MIKVFVTKIDETKKLELEINDFLEKKGLHMGEYTQDFHVLETHILTVLDY